MYYFIDFNDNEVNIYLLTPEQGAEVHKIRMYLRPRF